VYGFCRHDLCLLFLYTLFFFFYLTFIDGGAITLLT
jgi:hypothetical protein